MTGRVRDNRVDLKAFFHRKSFNLVFLLFASYLNLHLLLFKNEKSWFVNKRLCTSLVITFGMKQADMNK